MDQSRLRRTRSQSILALALAPRLVLRLSAWVYWLAFSQRTKHWLTLTVTGVESLPNNYIYLKLDKGNFRQILSAVEASTGVDIEILEED